MKRFLSILFFAIGLIAHGQLPTIHPGTVTIGTVPEATATDSILTVDDDGLVGHIPKSEVESQLVKVNDGNGPGWRLKGYDESNFRPLGNRALDFTVLSPTPDDADYGVQSNYGFTFGLQNKVGAGSNHFALGVLNVISGSYNNMALGGFNTVGGGSYNFAWGGNNTVTQGFGSGALGSYNTVNQNANGFGVAIGHNNVLTDIATNALGTALISKSRYTVAVGVANTDYAETANNAARPIFVVGTGTTTTAAGTWNANLRRDGFIVRHNGHVEAPELTTAKIDAGVDKTLVTKEWVTANPVIPTLDEVLNELDSAENDKSINLFESSFITSPNRYSSYGSKGLTFVTGHGFADFGHPIIKATESVNSEFGTRTMNLLLPYFWESQQAGNLTESQTIATREWVAANAGASTLQEVLTTGNTAHDTSIELTEDVVTFGTTSYSTIFSGSNLFMNNVTDDFNVNLTPEYLSFLNYTTGTNFDIVANEYSIKSTNGASNDITLSLTGNGGTPGIGTFVFPELASSATVATLATENFIETEISDITAKGSNFNTQYFYANGGSYQASGVSDLLTTFLVGDNTFSATDRENEAIYEGTLYFRYAPDAGSTTGITFSFAGDDYLIDTLSVEGGTYQYEIDYTLIFNTSPDTYSLILTAKRFNPDLSVAYNSYVNDYIDVAYTNSGDIDLDITINKNDAISEVRVFKAELKRVN